MPWFSKFLLQAGVVIVLVNLGGLWATVYFQGQHLKLLDQDQQLLADYVGLPTDIAHNSQNLSATPYGITSQNKLQNQTKILDDRFEAIESKQSDLAKDVKSLDQKVDKLSISTSGTSSQTSAAGESSEYTLYIGSGSTNQRDWTTINAASITIDSNKYHHIQAVYFEAGLSTIGGEVYARLINTGSGLINYNSQLMHNTPTATWKTAKINLDSGANTYAVQLKSSSGETVNLTGARIRIIAD